MVTIRWDIKTIDRLSMVEDVLKEFSCCDINIISMKVTPGRILIKSWCRQLQDISCVQSCLSQRADIIHVAYLCEEISELSTPEPERPRYFSDIICSSQSMHALIEKAIKIADSKYTVLIRGDTGTGKELLARAIHNSGQRRFYPFIPVNCSALPESLMESEFFGYEKGAFTDARKEKPGRMEVASGGTLFLDEIGNLSLSMQAKLLTALEKRQITRLGATQPIPIDIRLICATNVNIHHLVAEGTFRQDLLYRINTIELHIPPLRERGNDVILLAEHFLSKYARKYKKDLKGINRDGKNKLHNYAWPGNVRELQHAIERAVILSESNWLRPEDFILRSVPLRDKEPSDELNLTVLEKEAIERALRRAEGNITRAAELLGITRFTLYRKLEKFGL